MYRCHSRSSAPKRILPLKPTAADLSPVLSCSSSPTKLRDRNQPAPTPTPSQSPPARVSGSELNHQPECHVRTPGTSPSVGTLPGQVSLQYPSFTPPTADSPCCLPLTPHPCPAASGSMSTRGHICTGEVPLSPVLWSLMAITT